MPKHITKDLKENIVQFYKQKPMTIEFVADYFNVSNPSVIKILNEYKVERYSKTKLFSPDLDEHYFDQIDTEEKAYFLGLIITDGCIYSAKKKQPMVAMSIQECDVYILEKFCEEIKSNKSPTSDGRGAYGLQIISDKLVSGLRQYGLRERKTLNCTFPQNIPVDLYSHLVRGIFDGDGSASYYARQGRKRHTKAVRFCSGDYQFLVDLINFLHESCGADSPTIYQEKENLWSVRYASNKNMIKLIDYMYKDATVYLIRKKRICDLICNEINEYGNIEITA